MEINRSEECIEIIGETIITYARDPKGLKQGSSTGTYMSTNMLSLSCNYVDDMLDGLYTSYHENGLQKQIGCYTMGKRNGVFVTYNDTGDEIERCEYVDDLLQGIHISRCLGNETTKFYVDNLREGEETVRNWFYDYVCETRTYKSDKLIGCKYYYETGELRRSVEYSDGVKDGVEIAYLRGGKVSTTTSWKNGKKNGLRNMYYSNTKIMKMIPYCDDVIDGTVIKYHDNGNIHSNKVWTKGVKHGPCKSYYYSGGTAATWFCNDGIKVGEFKHFHENGIISAKGTYGAGKYDGKVYRYYPNGCLKSIKKYLNGSKNGYQVHYHENGNKSCDYILYRGKLQYIHTEYHQHGGYKTRTMFDSGKRVWVEEYRLNGSMLTYSEFVNNYRHGEVITYYDIDVDVSRCGIIWMKSKYINGGHSYTIVYNPDGSIKCNN
jgi:antitoxin component YwqK of YwqJK toxin-antitoxin module